MSTDLNAVVQTLCLAFDSDPVTEWAFPRHLANREAVVEGFFRATTKLLLEHGGHAAATPGHEAVGVWSPPGAPEPAEAAVAAYAGRLTSAYGTAAERALTVMGLIDAHRPAGLPPHFHVLFVGARPEYHKRGAAIQIMGMLAQALTETGAGVLGEASSSYSLALWRRMGASRIGTEIRLPAGPSLYPVWAAPEDWRLPRFERALAGGAARIGG